MSHAIHTLAALAAASVAASPTLASLGPAYEFEGAVALTAATGAIDRTTGWTFQTGNLPVEVSALGYFDAGNTAPAEPADGLFVAHDIALYDDAGSEITRTTVGPGETGFLNRNWRYNSINPILLPANSTFTIASFAPEGTYQTADPFDPVPAFDSDWLFPLPGGGVDARQPNIDFDPAVTFITSRFELFQPDLTFPTNTSNSRFGIAGANFIFEAIPAPGSAALLGLGALAATRRRR